MIKNSIFVKITILFIIAIIGLGAFSYYFIREEIEKEMLDRQLKYGQFLATINQLVRFGGDMELIEKYLNELELSLIRDPKILNRFKNHLSPDFSMGVIAKIIREQMGLYLLLQTPDGWKLYGDFHQNRFLNYYIITFIAFVIVIFLFVLVIRSILPLKKLRKEIKKFADGQTNISCILDQEDEIGDLAKEFQNAVDKIEALNHSRHLFLCSIMHELKTPITKGRIAAEMLDDELQKQRLCSVFERLNTLINEFAKIEELSSKNYCLNKQDILLHELLSKVFLMLWLDRTQIENLFVLPEGNFLLRADFEMFALALKNLIDNALKYKTQGKVTIAIRNNDLEIINQGTPLQCSLKEHSKPFFKDKIHKGGGLGLGIYIIWNVLESQGLELAYKHQDGMNVFVIVGVIKA